MNLLYTQQAGPQKSIIVPFYKGDNWGPKESNSGHELRELGSKCMTVYLESLYLIVNTFKIKLCEETRETSQKSIASSFFWVPSFWLDIRIYWGKKIRICHDWRRQPGSCAGLEEWENSSDTCGHPRGFCLPALILIEEKDNLDARQSKRYRTSKHGWANDASLQPPCHGSYKGDGSVAVLRAWEWLPQDHCGQWWHLSLSPSWTLIKGSLVFGLAIMRSYIIFHIWHLGWVTYSLNAFHRLRYP